MPIVNGRYEMIGEKRNASNGEWFFARDLVDGREVFVKEFEKYRYVGYEYDPEKFPGLKHDDDRTDAYRARMEKINSRLKNVAGVDGDVVVAINFFKEDVYLYKVNRKIDFLQWTPAEVSQRLTAEQIDGLMERLISAMGALHAVNILHCDLKPDNVFIVEKDGGYVGKISDFDDSFFADDIPDPQDIVSTPEYLSPELLMYICEYDVPVKNTSDIFALGLIYHEYLTGELPGMHGEGDTIADVLASGGSITLSEKLDAAHRVLIGGMLERRPEDRWKNCMQIANLIGSMRSVRGKTCTVTVESEAGPMAGELVELEYVDGEKSFPVGGCRTDANGRAVFIGLPHGKYRAKCREAVGTADWPSTAAVRLRASVPESAKADLRALVSADSAGVRGVELCICRKKDGKYITVAKAVTDADGKASFGRFAPGMYYWALLSVPEGYEAALRAPVAFRAEKGRGDISINVTKKRPPEKVGVRFLAQADDGLSVAGVELVLGVRTESGRFGELARRSTGDNGQAYMGKISPGICLVRISKLPEGYAGDTEKISRFKVVPGRENGFRLEVKRVRAEVVLEKAFAPPAQGMFSRLTKLADGRCVLEHVSGKKYEIPASDLGLYGLGEYK